jgi:GT2 family glycosyltransferase
MGLFYQIPSGVSKISLQSHPVLTTPQGGKIVIDKPLLALWEYAPGRELDEIIAAYQAQGAEPWMVRSALACLAEARLLQRGYEEITSENIQPVGDDLVSVVIVSFNSKAWLSNCLQSIFSQSYSPIEIIIVDNASADDTVPWLKENYPGVNLLQLDTTQSLAFAINSGIRIAEGKYFLLLNPDVELNPDAVAAMVAAARDDPNCAAVAAKLKFLWAPAFLNGLGNFVGAFHWGTDLALGHLDLGQFEKVHEVPSACFAAALVTLPALKNVGCLDENLPLYYEDSEWCYRSRLLGYHIRAAPRAIVLHAFSGRVPTGREGGLPSLKLQNVTYGRLHFITKILSFGYFIRFFLKYFIEDFIGLLLALISGQWANIRAYFNAWWNYFRALPNLRKERSLLQARRANTDAQIFSLQNNISIPMIWHGLPQLTWDLVKYHYAPLINSGQTRQMPEFTDKSGNKPSMGRAFSNGRSVIRAFAILKAEGFGGLVHRAWRSIQWHLMKP